MTEIISEDFHRTTSVSNKFRSIDTKINKICIKYQNAA